MGEPVVVKKKPSSKPGVVRFETNRALTGMGHERYRVDDEVWGERPPDVLARRIFARGGVDGVQVHGNMVTVDLEKGFDAEGLIGIIENMYVHYPENLVGADAPTEDAPVEVAAPAAPDEPVSPVAEAAPAAETAPAVDDAPVVDETEPAVSAEGEPTAE